MYTVGFEPTIPAIEDSSFFRPRGHCDRRERKLSWHNFQVLGQNLPVGTQENHKSFDRDMDFPGRDVPNTKQFILPTGTFRSFSM
jgi:hypothetical protein